MFHLFLYIVCAVTEGGKGWCKSAQDTFKLANLDAKSVQPRQHEAEQHG